MEIKSANIQATFGTNTYQVDFVGLLNTSVDSLRADFECCVAINANSSSSRPYHWCCDTSGKLASKKSFTTQRNGNIGFKVRFIDYKLFWNVWLVHSWKEKYHKWSLEYISCVFLNITDVKSRPVTIVCYGWNKPRLLKKHKKKQLAEMWMRILHFFLLAQFHTCFHNGIRKHGHNPSMSSKL